MNLKSQNQTIEIKSATPKNKLIIQQLKLNSSKPELKKYKINISKYIYSSKKKIFKSSKSNDNKINKINTFGITNENSEESVNSDEYISSTNLDVDTNTYIYEQNDKISDNERNKNNNIYSKGRVVSILDDDGKPKKLLKGANKFKKINTNVKFKDYLDDKNNNNNIHYKKIKINNDIKKNIIYKKDEKHFFDNEKISHMKIDNTKNLKKISSRNNKNKISKNNTNDIITNKNASNVINNIKSVNINKNQHIDSSKLGRLENESNSIYYVEKIKPDKNAKKNIPNIGNNYYKIKTRNSKKITEQLNSPIHTNNTINTNNNYNKSNLSSINNINNNNIIFSPLKVININIENGDETPVQINRKYVQSNLGWVSFIYPNEKINKGINKNKYVLINKNNLLSIDKSHNKINTGSEKEFTTNSNKFEIKKNYSYIKKGKKNHFSISPKSQNMILENYFRYDTLNNQKNKNKSFIHKKDIYVNKNRFSKSNNKNIENYITNSNSKTINNNCLNETNNDITYSFYINNENLNSVFFNKKIQKNFQNSDIILAKNNSKAKYEHNHSLSSFNGKTINNTSSLYNIFKPSKNFLEGDGINKVNESNDNTHKLGIKRKYKYFDINSNINSNINTNINNNINSNNKNSKNNVEAQKLINDKKRINFKKQIIPLKKNISNKFKQFIPISPNNMIKKIIKGKCNNYINNNFLTINSNS